MMTMNDTGGFRAVLHEWARRQLEEKSPHVGPFEIVDVRMDYDAGWGGTAITPGDPSITDIRIRFRHEGTACPIPSYLTNRGRCLDEAWSTSDSETTVSMVNQLLAIADE